MSTATQLDLFGDEAAPALVPVAAPRPRKPAATLARLERVFPGRVGCWAIGDCTTGTWWCLRCDAREPMPHPFDTHAHSLFRDRHRTCPPKDGDGTFPVYGDDPFFKPVTTEE